MRQRRIDRCLPTRHRQRPEFYQLSIFLKVVETRSFTATARLTGRTQPAISQAIARLEDVYGGDLFERRRGAPLELTTIGEAILPSARALLAAVDDQLVHAADAAQSETGTLRLGFDPDLASVARRELAAFSASHPAVRLRMVEARAAHALERLATREIDLAMVPFTMQPSEMSVDHETLWQEQLVVAMPADHPFTSHGEISWPMISSAHLLVGEDNVIHAEAARLTSGEVTEHAVPLEAIFCMVSLGLGITVAPACAVTLRSDVVFRPIEGESAILSIEAVWRRQDSNPLRHRLLRQLHAYQTR